MSVFESSRSVKSAQIVVCVEDEVGNVVLPRIVDGKTQQAAIDQHTSAYAAVTRVDAKATNQCWPRPHAKQAVNVYRILEIEGPSLWPEKTEIADNRVRHDRNKVLSVGVNLFMRSMPAIAVVDRLL